jgi:hypothetical protein
MKGLKHKYCLSFFKAILFLVGLTFLVAQSSFKFYRFASFPFRLSSTNVISQGAISGGTTTFLHHGKEVKISLLLDKRYDFKHVFISPSPFLRLATLLVESNSYCLSLRMAFVANAGRLVSMRGPPNLS